MRLADSIIITGIITLCATFAHAISSEQLQRRHRRLLMQKRLRRLNTFAVEPINAADDGRLPVLEEIRARSVEATTRKSNSNGLRRILQRGTDRFFRPKPPRSNRHELLLPPKNQPNNKFDVSSNELPSWQRYTKSNDLEKAKGKKRVIRFSVFDPLGSEDKFERSRSAERLNSFETKRTSLITSRLNSRALDIRSLARVGQDNDDDKVFDYETAFTEPTTSTRSWREELRSITPATPKLQRRPESEFTEPGQRIVPRIEFKPRAAAHVKIDNEDNEGSIGDQVVSNPQPTRDVTRQWERNPGKPNVPVIPTGWEDPAPKIPPKIPTPADSRRRESVPTLPVEFIQNTAQVGRAFPAATFNSSPFLPNSGLVRQQRVEPPWESQFGSPPSGSFGNNDKIRVNVPTNTFSSAGPRFITGPEFSNGAIPDSGLVLGTAPAGAPPGFGDALFGSHTFPKKTNGFNPLEELPGSDPSIPFVDMKEKTSLVGTPGKASPDTGLAFINPKQISAPENERSRTPLPNTGAPFVQRVNIPEGFGDNGPNVFAPNRVGDGRLPNFVPRNAGGFRPPVNTNNRQLQGRGRPLVQQDPSGLRVDPAVIDLLDVALGGGGSLGAQARVVDRFIGFERLRGIQDFLASTGLQQPLYQTFGALGRRATRGSLDGLIEEVRGALKLQTPQQATLFSGAGVPLFEPNKKAVDLKIDNTKPSDKPAVPLAS